MPRIPGGPSGYAGFDPRQIPGCVAWWSTDDLPDSGVVASWTSRVGGYSLTQGVPAAQPAVSNINGVKALYFDALDDVMTAGDVLDLGTNDMAIIGTVDALSIVGNYITCVSKANSGGLPVGAWGFFYRADNPYGYEPIYRSSAALRWTAHGTATVTGKQVAAVVLGRAAGVYRVWDKNGTKQLSVPWVPESENLDSNCLFLLRGYSGIKFGAEMTQGDILIFMRSGSTPFSDDEISALRSWQRWRFRIA